MPPPTPLVTVVLPVYNGERYLRDALDCALAQDHGNVEVVVVDDGSRDGTPAILATYADRVRVIRQANAGPGRARNAGIEAARGEYVAFLDADDLWRPEKVRLQAEHLTAHPTVGLVYNHWRVLDEEDPQAAARFLAPASPDSVTGAGDGTDLPGVAATGPLDGTLDAAGSGWLYHRLLLDSMVHTSAAMIRRSLLEEAGGFDEALRRGQDYDLWLRLSRRTEFHQLGAVLSAYRQHSESITRKPTPVNYGAVVLGRALDRWGTRGPDGSTASRLRVYARLAGLWYSFGRRHLERGDPLTARRSLWTSCRMAPWRPGYWRQWLKACLTRPS